MLLEALPPAGALGIIAVGARRRALCGAGAQARCVRLAAAIARARRGLSGGRMVGRLRHAGRQHLRPRLARPRLLAPRSRLRAARRRCADPPAPRALGTARGPGGGGRGHRRSCCSPGAWNDLSMLKEYANRADSFWREARQHLWLAFGSLAAACLVGLPLGILCHRVRALADGDPAGAQHRPDDPQHRALRHPDRAARLSRRACAARCGARHPRHRRGARLRRAVSLFPAAGRRQHGRRAEPGAGRRHRCGARHGHVRRASACCRSSCRWRFRSSWRASASSWCRISGLPRWRR